MDTSPLSINASEDRLSLPPPPPGTSSGDPLTGATSTSSDRPSSQSTISTSTQLKLPDIPENRFYRYLILKPTPPGQLKSIKLTQKVSALRGSYTTVKELPDGNMLITCSTKHQQDTALQISQIGDVKVTVFPHHKYNQCKGIIRDREFDLLTQQEIVDMFNEVGEPVSEAYKFNKRSDSDDRVTVCLTFDKSELPSRIKFGYKMFRVFPYIPRPRFCTNCLEYGHPTKFCRSSTKCPRCACTDCVNIGGSCEKEQKCGNCQGSHTSDDKNCKMFERQKQLMEIITQERLSRREAIREWSRRNNNQSFLINNSRPSFSDTLQTASTKPSPVTPRTQPKAPPRHNKSPRGQSSRGHSRGGYNNTGNRRFHIPDSDEESVESTHSNPDLSSRTKSLSDNSISNQGKISAPKTSSIPRAPPKRHRSESGSLSSSPNRIKKLNRDTRSNHQVIGDSVYFHGGGSPFSNFHSCSIPIPFKSLGCPPYFLPKSQQQKTTITLNDSETLYQFRKGWAFEDEESCKDILNCSSPKDVKKRSHTIKKYNADKWHDTHAISVMCECVYRKFEHNPNLKQHLMAAPDQFVEASTTDTFWGTGEVAGSLGRGRNMLGKILTALRNFYRDQSTDPFNFKDLKHRIDTDDHASFIVHV